MYYQQSIIMCTGEPSLGLELVLIFVYQCVSELVEETLNLN